MEEDKENKLGAAAAAAAGAVATPSSAKDGGGIDAGPTPLYFAFPTTTQYIGYTLVTGNKNITN